MAAIARTPIETDAAGPWLAVAHAARAWVAAQGIAWRDVVVLVPFSALLPPARAAFAALPGWQPRIETPLTLAAALGPPPEAAGALISGDPVQDRLRAAALLRQWPWGAARERDDRRGFAHLVAAVADTAQALRKAALARAPGERAAFWARARDTLPATGGPGALEALLLRVALEWAAQGVAAATDRLFDHRPAAWVLVRIGGAEDLAEALPAATGCPGLLLDLDAAPPADARPARWVCDDLESEAQAAAAMVVDALNAGRVPVALVALDRALVRRTRALLERVGVEPVDESGWTLSTTQAAARVMSLLRAATGHAGADARLDWLKHWPPARRQPHAAQALESLWRGSVRRRDDTAAQALWAEAQAHLQPFGARRERPLAGWLALLRERFAADGSLEWLRADAAGAQVLAALRLDSADAAWRDAAEATPLDLAGFTAWVDATLETAQFLPPAAPTADVVLTPLARAIGRPFAQVVVPGADHLHLGAVEPAPGLAGEAWAADLGLDHAARRLARQRLAFAQLLRVPALTLLRRRREADEPLAPSPEVEALALAQARTGRPLQPEAPWQPPQRALQPAPIGRPAPAAADDLPPTLSASTVEALRQCPYRFFARAVLRLAEPDELEAGLAKRDYGEWLHGVLHRFHRGRGAAGDDAAALQRAVDDETAERGLDEAELLPFRASFDHFAPAYLRWLAAREAAGHAWHDGEAERRLDAPALAPHALQGRLDRLDRGPDGTLQVIDYKTGSAGGLRKKVTEPLEDTQLAFYAALEPQAVRAFYLALDDPRAPLEIEHPDVAATAATLVASLGGEMARLRAGAGLPALGEPPVCDHCEARGLCRRDHWSPA